jgi:hypothetical protein
MGQTSSNQVDILYKYKWNDGSGNSNKICASGLIGKVSLKPLRTKYRCGIYLTSQKWMNSRYLEDILSLGYTPDGLYSIDVNSLLNAGFTLIDNEDRTLKVPLMTGYLTRVWPAFGQVGGASEVIAVLDSSKDGCTSYCLDFKKEAEMLTAPRFQILNTDTVSLHKTIITRIYITLLSIIYAFFRDEEDLNEREGFIVRIDIVGFVLKFASRNLTISAGIKNMGKFCYGYLIGATWTDVFQPNGSYLRVLETTAPTVFHLPCSKFLNQSNNIVDKIINSALMELKIKILKGEFKKREVELPKI